MNDQETKYDWDKLLRDFRIHYDKLYDDHNQERIPSRERYDYYSFIGKDDLIKITVFANPPIRVRGYGDNYNYLSNLPLEARQSLLTYTQQRYKSNQTHGTSTAEDQALEKLKQAGVIQ